MNARMFEIALLLISTDGDCYRASKKWHDNTGNAFGSMCANCPGRLYILSSWQCSAARKSAECLIKEFPCEYNL